MLRRRVCFVRKLLKVLECHLASRGFSTKTWPPVTTLYGGEEVKRCLTLDFRFRPLVHSFKRRVMNLAFTNSIKSTRAAALGGRGGRVDWVTHLRQRLGLVNWHWLPSPAAAFLSCGVRRKPRRNMTRTFAVPGCRAGGGI